MPADVCSKELDWIHIRRQGIAGEEIMELLGQLHQPKVHLEGPGVASKEARGPEGSVPLQYNPALGHPPDHCLVGKLLYVLFQGPDLLLSIIITTVHFICREKKHNYHRT